MRSCTWGDICRLEYGKALRDYVAEPSQENRFQVGTNGPIGWSSRSLTDGPGVIVGRKGAYRGIHFSAHPFFVIDTAYLLRPTDTELDLKWSYYKLLTVDMNSIDVGAAIPTTSRDAFYAMPVRVPSLSSQVAAAAVLSAYDESMENNRRRTGLLEEAARLLYREWFVHLRFPGHERTRIANGVPLGWARKTIGDVLTLKRGYDLPAAGRQDGEIPIVSSSGITGFHSEKKASAPGVVTGRYGTLGEVYFVDRDFWPLNTALYVSDFKGHSAFFALHLLKHELGSIQSDKAAIPGLNRNVVHDREILYPPESLRNQFTEFAEPIYRQLGTLESANQKLRAARDLLLPRLMSGEIAV
jgi:type I restriction enzyme, S subunit